MQRKTDDYLDQDVDFVLKSLGSGVETGLDPDEAARRMAEYGPNEITEREEPLWHRVFRRFWGPIPWMIEAAALLSALVQKWEDFAIILVMLLVNAGLDFFQEHRALNALQALKAKLANEAIVRRSGRFLTLPVRELVPGDIVKLRIGDIVPADVKLVDGDYLSIDQAALTGESLPVSRKAGAIAYANTIVKQGEMLALVVNTAMHTAFAGVVSLVAKAALEERSHFQRMVIQIGNFLILITIALVILIVMVSLFRHENFLKIARFARGWFWQRPWPAPLLFGATFGTEILGTVIAAEGWLMAPIGWSYALMIWGYALAWFVVNDGVKMATLRFLRQHTGEAATQRAVA